MKQKVAIFLGYHLFMNSLRHLTIMLIKV